MHRRWSVAALSVLAVVASLIPGRAQAFDTFAHTDLTSGAMTRLGFGGDAAATGQIFNWFPDLYHALSAAKMPASGRAGFWERLITPGVRSEDWSQSVIDAATRSHFYGASQASPGGQMPSLGTTQGITMEWERLQRAVGTLARQARDENNPEKLVAVLGMSLHPVQDFYSHTNWVEPREGHGVLGADGPGWAERGYGSNPTWFDIPANVRGEFRVYAAEALAPGGLRQRIHGAWNQDGNANLTTGMAKDWPGRPLFDAGDMSAYFASVQWLEAVRLWVNDDAFWNEAKAYHPANAEQRCELERDATGMHEIMFYSGQWQGQGEPSFGIAPGPGGNLRDLAGAVQNYFSDVCPKGTSVRPAIVRGGVREPRGGVRPVFGVSDGGSALGPKRTKTRYREQFENLILAMADPNASGPVGPVPSSIPLQRETRFVELQMNEIQALELGDPFGDNADMYANVRIDDHPSSSAEINSKNYFNFPRPFAPFTWIEAVPAAGNQQEPVETIEVEIKTANTLFAGTDDDVFLTLGPGLRFSLDKRFTNDFERGDRDTYSVPIDDAVAPGLRDHNTEEIALAPTGEAGRRSMRVGDIREVTIEKSPDGFAGGWKLGGVRLWVNGNQVYENQSINKWLEDYHRKWTAPFFEPSDPRGSKIPVSIFLADDDSNFYGADDEGDINPYDNRRVLSVGYTLGEDILRRAEGGGRLGGRVGFEHGDKARIAYRLRTITPEPPPAEPKPLPRQEEENTGIPDLIITDASPLGVTVMNQGNGDAGPFRVRAFSDFEQDAVSFPGLAAGASETRDFPHLSCEAGGSIAIADDLNQVNESDELNNERELEPLIC
jgi:hypothetical protein